MGAAFTVLILLFGARCIALLGGEGRDARATRSPTQHRLRRRHHGVDRQHALERAARQRQHAGAGPDAHRRRAGARAALRPSLGRRRIGIAGAGIAYITTFGIAALVDGGRRVPALERAAPARAPTCASNGGSSGDILRVGGISVLNSLQTVLTAVILTGFVGRYGAGGARRLRRRPAPGAAADPAGVRRRPGAGGARRHHHRRRAPGTRQAHRLDRHRASRPSICLVDRRPRRRSSRCAWVGPLQHRSRGARQPARSTCAPWRRSTRCSPRASRSTSPRRARAACCCRCSPAPRALLHRDRRRRGRGHAARHLRGDRGGDGRRPALLTIWFVARTKWS